MVDVADKSKLNGDMPIGNSLAPDQDGARCLPYSGTLQAGVDFEIDLSLPALRAFIRSVQTLWIDNAAGANQIVVTVFGSNQVLRVPAGESRYLPCLMYPMVPRVTLNRADAGAFQIIFVNVPIPTTAGAPVAGATSVSVTGPLGRRADAASVSVALSTEDVALWPASLGRKAAAASFAVVLATEDVALFPTSLGVKAAAASFAVTQSTEDVARVGIVTETAPATDTASSGLNGRLQRIAQRLTSLIALLPTALGSAAAAASLAVTQSTEDVARVGIVTETAPATDTASSGLNGRLQRIAQRITTLISSTLAVAGPTAADAALTANPVTAGGLAKTANPTAVADGDVVNALHDKLGKQIVVPAIRDLKGVQATTITSSTAETTIVAAAGAGVFADLYALILSNRSATGIYVTIKDATAGTTRAVIYAPANDVRGFALDAGSAIPQAAANANWTATCSASIASLEVTALYVRNI